MCAARRSLRPPSTVSLSNPRQPAPWARFDHWMQPLPSLRPHSADRSWALMVTWQAKGAAVGARFAALTRSGTVPARRRLLAGLVASWLVGARSGRQSRHDGRPGFRRRRDLGRSRCIRAVGHRASRRVQVCMCRAPRTPPLWRPLDGCLDAAAEGLLSNRAVEPCMKMNTSGVTFKVR